MKRNGRDGRGLTTRMRQALPLMVEARTLEQGIARLAADKIVSRSVYFAKWLRDPAWIRALNDAREEALSKAQARAVEQIIANVESHVAILQQIAIGSKIDPATRQPVPMIAHPGQVEAIKECLRIAGLEDAARNQRGQQQDFFALLREEIMAGESERRGQAADDISNGLEEYDDAAIPVSAAGPHRE